MGDISLWTKEQISFDTGGIMTRLLLLHSGSTCASDDQVLWLRGTYVFEDKGVSPWDARWRWGSYFAVSAYIATNNASMLAYLDDHCPCLGE